MAANKGGEAVGGKIDLLMAMATIIMLPCVIVYFLTQRWFIQGIIFMGLKG